MSYAKLRTLKLKNFMSIADAEIPIGAITNICGYNDQGKSAIRTALSVVMYDSDSNDQVKFIKDGTEFFEITCVFEDGVVISKTKKLNGASIWLMKQGNTVVYSNITGDKVIAVEDVPEPIAQYWGVYSDEATGQLLNVRTDRDSHFLTDTSGGENYKILSPLLHSEVLSKASAELIKDSNACKNAIDEQTTRYNMYTEMLENKVAPTEEMLKQLQVFMDSVVCKKNKQELVENLVREDGIVKTTEVSPEIKLVDVNKLQLIEQISITQDSATDTMYDELVAVDMGRLCLLETLMQACERAVGEVNIPKAELVNIDKLEKLQALLIAQDSVSNIATELNTIQNELSNTETELTAAKQAMTDAGYRICKNCGSLVD